MTSRPATVIAGLLAMCLLASCARNPMILRVSGTIMYDKPKIEQVSHDLEDAREEGGAAVLKVSMVGDPGLKASFDIYPGVVEGRPMSEIAEGSYSGEFSLPEEVVGGPFTVVVRLRDEVAGETVWRDSKLIIIPHLESTTFPDESEY